MQQHKPESHILCPNCGVVFQSSAAQHFPAVRTTWKRRGTGKHDPDAVTLSDLADDPESFVFED